MGGALTLISNTFLDFNLTHPGWEAAITGQRVGYTRVSSLDQNIERQLDGVDLDRVFTDKASGKDVTRPQLEALLGFVRDGDTVIVHSMDRLARNLDDLRATVRTLTARGVRVEFVKEQLTFTGEDSPMATLLLSVMGAFAEFERALIRERQREGIALAKQRGAYRGRRNALTTEQAALLTARAAAGVAKADRARIRRQPRDRLPIPPGSPNSTIAAVSMFRELVLASSLVFVGCSPSRSS